MIITFEKEYLRDYYERGKSDDKKHRYQPSVIKSYTKSVNFLKAAQVKEDLYAIKSLHFESLKGDKEGLYSVRAGLKYRIEFTLKETFEESILTICNIIELSNHYD